MLAHKFVPIVMHIISQKPKTIQYLLQNLLFGLSLIPPLYTNFAPKSTKIPTFILWRPFSKCVSTGNFGTMTVIFATFLAVVRAFLHTLDAPFGQSVLPQKKCQPFIRPHKTIAKHHLRGNNQCACLLQQASWQYLTIVRWIKLLKKNTQKVD